MLKGQPESPGRPVGRRPNPSSHLGRMAPFLSRTGPPPETNGLADQQYSPARGGGARMQQVLQRRQYVFPLDVPTGFDKTPWGSVIRPKCWSAAAPERSSAKVSVTLLGFDNFPVSHRAQQALK